LKNPADGVEDRGGATMIPYKSPLLTTVPQTLEKRREMLQAIRALAAQDGEQLRKRRTEIALLRRELTEIALTLQELRRACDPRLRSHVIRDNPDQPVALKASPDDPKHPGWPAGTPDGRGGKFRPKDGDEGAPGGKSDVRVAAGWGRPGYPIDLQEEESRGGHTIGAHVGRSESSLLSEIRQIASGAGAGVDLVRGLREGSFPSLEAANKLVNSTLAQNQDTIALVAAGLLPRAELDAQFDSPTGYEAFLRTGNSTPYIRPTYGVRVVIVPDPSSAKGYRVDTAFPRNSDW
jgi:hypothetical protein